MRTALIAALFAFVGFLPAASFAQADGNKLVLLRTPDSQKDTEIHLAKILLEKLKINASLQSPKGQPDNLIVRAKFKANEEKDLPAVDMLIDTKIARRNKDGQPVAQIISITSFADVELKEGKQLEMLGWVNNLNRQPVPMRVFLAGKKIGIDRNLLNATSFPLAENAVTFAFRRVYRAWPLLLSDMRKKGYLASE